VLNEKVHVLVFYQLSSKLLHLPHRAGRDQNHPHSRVVIV